MEQKLDEKVLKEKEAHLDRILTGMNRVLLAFSGGVDSTFLLYKGTALLGKDNILAVTASSPLHPPAETGESRRLAKLLGVRHLVIETDELAGEKFSANTPERCYYCKYDLYTKLKGLAGDYGYSSLVDGANHDDKADFRPGSRAAGELGVRSPLQEAGLTKEEIRLLSRNNNLLTWNKPSAACLASRFPYGERLEQGKISRVLQGEQFLKNLGLTGDVRVRFHGDLARIEVTAGEMELLIKKNEEVVRCFKKLNFSYITLDLEGFCSGSMNRDLA